MLRALPSNMKLNMVWKGPIVFELLAVAVPY